MSESVVPAQKIRNTSNDDEIDIGFLLGSLWDHKYFIGLVAFVFALCGFVYGILATPIYRADSLVQVEQKSSSMAGADLEAALGGEPENPTSTQVEILKSRLILRQVVDQTSVDIRVTPKTLPLIGQWLVRSDISRPNLFDTSGYIWGGETLSIASFVTDHDSEGMELRIRSDGNQRYTVMAPDEDRVIAKGRVGIPLEVEEPWFELRVDELTAPEGAIFKVTKQNRLAATRELQGRLDIAEQGKDTGMLRLSLDGPDRKEVVSSLNAVNQVFLTQNIARQAAEAEKSLEFLDEQVPQVRQQLTEAEDRLNEFRLKSDSVDLSFETENALSSLVEVEASLNELELQEAELARRFTEYHPVYRALVEKKEQLQREKARLEDRTDNLPRTQQQVLRLSRDVQVTQEIYVQLLNRMQELQLAKAGTVGNVRILDEAEIQGQVEPRRGLITGVSLLAGLLLAMVVVLLRAAFNRGIVSSEQLEDLGLPVYATVPLSEEEKRGMEAKSSGGNKKSRRKHTDLLAFRNPADLSIEAIRGLRTSLHFAMMEGADNRLVITGPSPGIGKSFISSNLGAICAVGGQRVVVVDADMRKGHLHIDMGQEAKSGLSEVISGKLGFEASVRESKINGLHWVSRGISPPNPSELLMQPGFTEFLDHLSCRYDLVILDTPPILAVTDAAIIAKQCSTALMVVRFGVNTQKEIEIAQARLATGGVNLKGTILNAVERRAANSYGYYGYYNYSYK